MLFVVVLIAVDEVNVWLSIGVGLDGSVLLLVRLILSWFKVKLSVGLIPSRFVDVFDLLL